MTPMPNDPLPPVPDSWKGQYVHFVTGRLAEFSLRKIVATLAPEIGFTATVEVLNITVAALMTPTWVASRLHVPPEATVVLLPGYCKGDLSPVREIVSVPVMRGPRDVRRLRTFMGREERRVETYGAHDIEIIAEINHAPNRTLDELLSEAAALRAAGADVIDVGCNPGETWHGVGEAVGALRDRGCRISIDSLNGDEIAAATAAGAELVLSVNASNRHAAADWGCEVVAIPDDPATLAGLDDTIEVLAAAGVPIRIDPVLSPIGFGFAESLRGYSETRRKYPDAEMMMGIGNLTELTDVDSAGVNVLLMGICQELGIRSVLTTQVINWARTSVRECDLARRLTYHAVKQQTLPKRVDSRLILLRDPEVPHFDEDELDRLSHEIRDHNYRIFADGDQLHLIGGGNHWTGRDPFAMFQEVLRDPPRTLSRGHAFYLGYEMAKAATALTLGKDYRQDEALDWGFLTESEEDHHRIREAREP